MSKDRIYFTDNVSNSLVILNRGIDGQVTGSVPIDFQTTCIKIDNDSNVFVKARGKKVTCHDKNGQLVCANYLNEQLNLYDYFNLLDKHCFTFLDLKQINSIVF